MRKGFLNGTPAKKKEPAAERKFTEPNKEEAEEKQDPKVVADRGTGAVPKQTPKAQSRAEGGAKSDEVAEAGGAETKEAGSGQEGKQRQDVGGAAVRTVVKKRRRTRSHNSSPSPGRGFFVPGYNGDKSMSVQVVLWLLIEIGIYRLRRLCNYTFIIFAPLLIPQVVISSSHFS